MYRTAANIAVLAFTVLATPAKDTDWDFLLYNYTADVIEKIEIAPAGSGNWTPNRGELESGSGGKVAVGQKTTVLFDKAANVCRFDIRATFDDRTTAVWSGINLCDNAQVVVFLRGGQATFYAI